MSSTTIKVPKELRDRLATLAGQQHTTLAGVVENALDAVEESAFWSGVAAAMGGRPFTEATGDASLTEGLDPDESWDDVW